MYLLKVAFPVGMFPLELVNKRFDPPIGEGIEILSSGLVALHAAAEDNVIFLACFGGLLQMLYILDLSIGCCQKYTQFFLTAQFFANIITEVAH